MSYHGLPEFLENLGESGEIVRVDARVDPVLEAAEITRQAAAQNGKALLFGSAGHSHFPLLTNLLGTDARICRALGAKSLQELTERVAGLIQPPEAEGWFEKVLSGPARTVLKKFAPKTVKTGACQQVVRLGADVDLTELPVIQAFPEESEPTITAGQVLTAHAETGRAHVGRYDVRLLDRNRLAVCWYAHDEPLRLMAGYAERKARMPVAIVLGGDPAGLLAAMAPLPPETDVAAIAGFLRDKPIELVQCRTIDLKVPTDAEMVIEGTIDPAAPPVEIGHMVGPGGFCSSPPPMPVIHVTAFTHRTNPVYPAMVRGEPPHEETVIRRALQRVFRPLVAATIPDLVAYDFPAFGAARHWGFASIRKSYAGQARRVAAAVWGWVPTMFTKFLVVVDEDVDVHDPAQVWAAVAACAAPGRDVWFQDGPPDPWDPAATPGTLGRRMAIDATRKLPGEGAAGQGGPARMTEEILRRVHDRWSEYQLGPRRDDR